MTKFEEFERDFAKVVDKLLPGSKCAKISVTFVTEDGASAEIDITREGYEHLSQKIYDPLKDEDLYPEDEECACGDIGCIHGR
jgi:hypothetical protein